jgi:hypothetical protein
MKILGFDISIGRVKANLVTDRIVVRRKGKLVLLVGTSVGTNVKRKVFVRTEMFDGLRLSVGKIRKEVRA